MDTRRKLYKATRNAPTLSERVKKNRAGQENKRFDKFAANRKIELDDVDTPVRPARQLSKIKDKSERLKAYIQEKKNAKIIQKNEERSPFIPYVPIGRWLEKKESTKKVIKSTGSTVKRPAMKETTNTVVKEKKSVKKLELVAENVVVPESDEKALNSTFELLPDISSEEEKPVENKENVKKDPVVPKSRGKARAERKVAVKKSSAKIVVPVKRREQPVVAVKSNNRAIKKTESVSKNPVKKNVQDPKPAISSSSSSESIKEVAPETQKEHSHTYKFYKSAMHGQHTYLSLQLKKFAANMTDFIELLSDSEQAQTHQTLQQGNLIINDKFKAFEDVLNKFEDSVGKVTEEDVENYWSLLYDQIESFKENLQFVEAAKKKSLKAQKRKTRDTLLLTPRRSRRIAENSDTPKHNTSCHGCILLSASKVNTPKSAHKRRTAFKKSMAFDDF